MTNEERKDKQPKNHKTAQAPAEHSESINLEQINGSDFDFYSANSDYIGATISSTTTTAPPSASGTMNSWKTSRSTGTIRSRSYCRSQTATMSSRTIPHTASTRVRSISYRQVNYTLYTLPPTQMASVLCICSI